MGTSVRPGTLEATPGTMNRNIYFIICIVVMMMAETSLSQGSSCCEEECCRGRGRRSVQDLGSNWLTFTEDKPKAENSLDSSSLLKMILLRNERSTSRFPICRCCGRCSGGYGK